MKFARQAKIFRGPLDAAPVAGVVMLLVIFMLVSSLLYTPGVLIQLPNGEPQPVAQRSAPVKKTDNGGVGGQSGYD
jgi:biopolymer transport protein ExbD